MQLKPNCSTCNAPLIWLKAEPSGKNPNPKPNPINALPSEHGNLEINRENGTYRILNGAQRAEAEANNKPLYLSHFASCQDAKKFRRK